MGEWVEQIKPCYYKGERGNKPSDLELMLRLYVLQNLYTLEGTVAEVTDSRAFSEFCGVESSNQVPDGDTLGRFRNLLSLLTGTFQIKCTIIHGEKEVLQISFDGII